MSRQLERLLLKEKALIRVPEEIVEKFDYLCQEIPEDEWSAILLYSIVSGSIREPENLVIKLEDVIPMDKGSKAATSYNYNEPKRDGSGIEDKHIDYIMDNPHAEDWKIAHLHSHNTMPVYFSSTDMSEQDDNSPNHNFYLSFIVNNYRKYVAEISFIIKAEAELVVPYKAFDENGEIYEYTKSTFKVDKEKLVVLKCNLEIPFVRAEVDTTFAESVKDIITKKDKEQKALADARKQHPQTWNMNQNNLSPSLQRLEDLTDIEEFVITLLRGTNPPDASCSSIEEALEDIVNFYQDGEVNGAYLVNSLLNNYEATFEKVFGDRLDLRLTVTEEVIEILENHEDVYSFISETIMSLKALVHKIEEADANRTATV